MRGRICRTGSSTTAAARSPHMTILLCTIRSLARVKHQNATDRPAITNANKISRYSACLPMSGAALGGKDGTFRKDLRTATSMQANTEAVRILGDQSFSHSRKRSRFSLIATQ